MENNESFIYCIFESEPIDFWRGWTPIFDYSRIPFSSPTMKPLSPILFSAFVEFMFKLSQLGWSGNIRNNIEIYYSGEENLQYGTSLFHFALKQDNNGITYIGGSDEQSTMNELNNLHSEDYKIIYPIVK